jgi:hypothetical protein
MIDTHMDCKRTILKHVLLPAMSFMATIPNINMVQTAAPGTAVYTYEMVVSDGSHYGLVQWGDQSRTNPFLFRSHARHKRQLHGQYL